MEINRKSPDKMHINKLMMVVRRMKKKTIMIYP